MTERTSGAWGLGLATVSEPGGRVLDAWFPAPRLGLQGAPHAAGTQPAAEPGELAGAQRRDERRGVRTVAVTTVLADLAAPPVDPYDAYLRLHLLSHRLVRPHGLALEGIFGVLANVAWTTRGPVDPADLPAVRLRCRLAGEPLGVHGVDKFPRMTDYVVPSGVRIADADRVRLGAHLAEGTTVMH